VHRVLSAPVILFIFFLHILDLTITPLITLGSARVIFVYLFVVYAAFQWEGQQATPAALMAGLLRDLSGSEILGSETLALTASAIFLDWFSQKLDRRSAPVRAAAAFFFFASTLSLVLILSAFSSPENAQVPAKISILFQVSLANAALTAVFFPLLSQWFRDDRPLRQYELFR